MKNNIIKIIFVIGTCKIIVIEHFNDLFASIVLNIIKTSELIGYLNEKNVLHHFFLKL